MEGIKRHVSSRLLKRGEGNDIFTSVPKKYVLDKCEEMYREYLNQPDSFENEVSVFRKTNKSLRESIEEAVNDFVSAFGINELDSMIMESYKSV